MEKRLKALISEKTIVLHYDGQKINIQKATDNLLFEELKVLVEAGDEKELIRRFTDVKKRMEKYTGGVITVIEGQARLKGDETTIPKVILDKLVDMEKTKEDFLPLIRFWKKLKLNPNPASREDLYGFVIANKVPLTEGGDIVVEKGVSQKRGGVPGHLIDGHSGTVDNSVGNTVSMARANVDDDNRQTCSNGLHVAAPDFVRRHWSQPIIIECIVNPRDVVAVPHDYNNTKMRVCRYVVAGYSPKSGRTEKVMRLEDFITRPDAEVQSKLEAGVTDGQTAYIDKTKKVTTLPTAKTVVTSTKYSDQIDGKTAKQIIAHVKAETGQVIDLSLKNKGGIIKKALSLLETHDIAKQLEADNAKSGVRKTVKKVVKVEKGPWTLALLNVGGNKLEVVELIKELTGCGLKEAKQTADRSLPVIFTNASKRFALRHETMFKDIGCKTVVSKGEIKAETKEITLSTLNAKQLRDEAKSKFNEVFPSRDTKGMILDKVTTLFQNAGYEVS